MQQRTFKIYAVLMSTIITIISLFCIYLFSNNGTEFFNVPVTLSTLTFVGCVYSIKIAIYDIFSN